MKNKCAVRWLSFIVGISVLTGLLSLFASCGTSKWKSDVMGSNVWEATYEEMEEDYTSEKFTDYASFSKSSWADYRVNANAPLKDECYDKAYFKEYDLIILRFNMTESGYDFTVADVTFSGEECTVQLLPVLEKKYYDAAPSSYICFVETKTDVSPYSAIRLEMLDTVINDNFSFDYIAEDNQPYLFAGETVPVLFCINSPKGEEDFIENDEILTKSNYIYKGIKGLYNEEKLKTQQLLLIRLPASDFESISAYYEDNVLHIVGAYSNHYWYPESPNYHKLISLLIPKDAVITEVTRTIYYEYEDDLTEKKTFCSYTVNPGTAITDALMEYTLSAKTE